MNSVQRRKKLRVAHKKQGGLCFYCSAGVALGLATLDHKIPKARGGSNHQRNLVMACPPCNQAKADLTAEEFRPVMALRVERWKSSRKGNGRARGAKMGASFVVIESVATGWTWKMLKPKAEAKPLATLGEVAA